MLHSDLKPCLVLLFLIFFMGCNEADNPVTPTSSADQLVAAQNISQPVLWGYYDIFIDPESETVEVAVNRSAGFTLNLLNTLNNVPNSVKLYLNSISEHPDYWDIDIDIGISHPFPDHPEFAGYDVRGVFMGNGSGISEVNSDLRYALRDVDQMMFTNPDTGFGGPDGYTRWFNKPEFSMGGMPLFQYTPWNISPPDFNGNATLNPYKYYADGIGVLDDTFTWLIANADQRGVFSQSSYSVRNFYLRFPKTVGLQFGFAVLANWEGIDIHPANAPESPVVKVHDTSKIYYVDEFTKGGNLKLDIDIFGWEFQPSDIHIESTVLSALFSSPATDIAVGSTELYTTYRVDIPADGMTSHVGNEMFIYAEYDQFDYSNDFGVQNLADEDPLTAVFRHDVSVSSVYCPDVTFDSIDFDPPNGLTLVFQWMYTGIEIYGSGFYGSTGLKVEFQGLDPVPVSNVVSNGTDTIILDADFTGTLIGQPYDLYIENECGNSIIVPDLFTIMGEEPCFTTMPDSWDSVTSDLVGYMGFWPTRAADPPYMIGTWFDMNWDFAVAPLSDLTDAVKVLTPSTIEYGVMSSYDRLYYVDFGNELQVKYRDWEGTTLSDTWYPYLNDLDPGFRIYGLAIDETDNPIALLRTDVGPEFEYRVYHSDGSSWGDMIEVPQSIVDEFGWYSSAAVDFDYNPDTGDYVISERTSGPGIHAFDADGVIHYSNGDVFGISDLGSFVYGRIFIDVGNPMCRVIFVASRSGSYTGPHYIARFNSNWLQETTTSYDFELSYGNITVTENDSGYALYGFSQFDHNRTTIIPLTDW